MSDPPYWSVTVGFPGTGHRARPAEVREMGDVMLLRDALSDRFGTT
ncbi:hypothetical protein [Micromonospora sp. NPDC050200]